MNSLSPRRCALTVSNGSPGHSQHDRGQHVRFGLHFRDCDHQTSCKQPEHSGRQLHGRGRDEPRHPSVEFGGELGSPGHRGGRAGAAPPGHLLAVQSGKDGKWMFGEPFCIANGFFNTCFGIISTLTMTLISFDRYYAIVRQPQAKIGRRRATQLLVAVWFCAVVFSFPWYLLMETSGRLVVHKQGFYHCMYVFHSGTSRMGTSYSIALIVVCYLLPFALMCFCHYNICKTVRLSEIRVRPVTTYAHLLRFYSEMRTATTVLIMIVFSIFCWGPYCLMGIITALGSYSFNPAMDTVAIWMAWANGAINPLIYAIRNPNISMLLGRSREEGYRTRNIAAYLSTQTQRRDAVRTRADRIRDRYVSRHGANSRMSSSSPANGGDVAMWACKNPAVFFCRDAHPDTITEPAVPKVETADTSL
ncbi:G-protein coupled receptor 135 isoform X2 [Pseudorasbora parva]|uniref:G-protein coupled receptor 135 isoform X2 n=1 Tax=Pseudorasbora parva TaxID=51549 RepID=UPI00351EE819